MRLYAYVGIIIRHCLFILPTLYRLDLFKKFHDSLLSQWHDKLAIALAVVCGLNKSQVDCVFSSCHGTDKLATYMLITM